LTEIKIAENCKSKCCGKFEKGEHKRCKRCPMFDLMKKAHYNNIKNNIITNGKLLNTNIIDENGQLFREHCWVTINELLEKFIPSKNTIKKIIMFDAKIKDYQTRGPQKQTLTSFKDICLIRKNEITK
jgi:hypothetical protein